MVQTGKDPVIPKQESDCMTKLDKMSDDTVEIICKEICLATDENGAPTFTKNPEGNAYLKNSSICAAAADAFSIDEKILKGKKFGVKKVANPVDKTQ